MKAAVYPGDGAPLDIRDLPDPEPGPDELIIAVERCGICGTDLHMTQGHAFQFPAGSVPGHEYAGTVVAKGRNVTGWSIGDRLTAVPSTGCGQCAACSRGNWTLCRNAPGQMGGFAEFARVAAMTAVRLPDALSAADGALIEPLAVGRYGVRQAGPLNGRRVLVLGAGAVALCAIWWARQLGAGQIVATSRASRRGDMALAMGADAFIEDAADAQANISAAFTGEAEVVLECIGSPGQLGRAIGLAGPFAQIVSMGFCTVPDALVPALAAFRGVTLSFPVGYTRHDFEASVDAMEQGQTNPRLLVTDTVPLSTLSATLDRLRGDHGETKVQVAPGMG
jgi:threonine dehydrogenase-like Zn-dependent dehydrogenase